MRSCFGSQGGFPRGVALRLLLRLRFAPFPLRAVRALPPFGACFLPWRCAMWCAPRLYRQSAYGIFSIRPLEDRYKVMSRRTYQEKVEPRCKKPRDVCRETVFWKPLRAKRRLEVLGDSKLIVNWLNGTWKCQFRLYQERAQLMHRALERSFKRDGVNTRCDTADYGRHIFRELNGEADALASQHAYTCTVYSLQEEDFRCYRLYFDGSVYNSGCGGGWILYGSTQVVSDDWSEWQKIAELSFSMQRNGSVTACELEACVWVVAFATSLCENVGAAISCLQHWTPLNVK